MHNSLLPSVEPSFQVTAYILSFCILTSYGPPYILNIYILTLCFTAEANGAFYGELKIRISGNPGKKHLFLLKNLNAWIGSDYSQWPMCIRCFGIGKLNKNKQRHDMISESQIAYILPFCLVSYINFFPVLYIFCFQAFLYILISLQFDFLQFF